MVSLRNRLKNIFNKDEAWDFSTINADATASYSVDGMQLVDRTRANRFSQASGAGTITPDDSLPVSLYLAVPAGPQVGQQSGSLQIAGRQQVTPLSPTAFKDGQAGAYALLVQNFVPTLQKSLNLLSLELVNQVNSVSSGAGSINPIFGFGSTSGGSAIADLGAERTPNNRSVKALLESASFDVLINQANPASSQYSSEVEQILLNQKFDARLFKSVASFSASQFANVTATAANSLEGLRSTFSQPVTFITSSVANTISTWTNNHKTNEAMSQVLSDQKNAISGVNLDEEAANLVKYQQLYNAASKLIQTNRQMFDTLLAMLSGN
jgi:flagellar hook-associated protein FlgK